MRAPIGQRIRKRRQELRRSQAALAAEVGISASYLNLIEHNKRTIGGALLHRIAETLALDSRALAGTEEARLIAELAEVATADVIPDAPPTCILSPADIEGPFYFDADQVRRDIRDDREGIRLDVRITVVRVDGCVPIADAVVDLWLADAVGRYSGYESQGTEGEAFHRIVAPWCLSYHPASPPAAEDVLALAAASR